MQEDWAIIVKNWAKYLIKTLLVFTIGLPLLVLIFGLSLQLLPDYAIIGRKLIGLGSLLSFVEKGALIGILYGLVFGGFSLMPLLYKKK